MRSTRQRGFQCRSHLAFALRLLGHDVQRAVGSHQAGSQPGELEALQSMALEAAISL